MYSRNLFVLDFARRFFVNCAQISEAYAVRTSMKFGGNWRKIGRKGKCMKDSESTSHLYKCLMYHSCFYIFLELEISFWNANVNKIAVIYKAAQLLSLRKPPWDHLIFKRYLTFRYLI